MSKKFFIQPDGAIQSYGKLDDWEDMSPVTELMYICTEYKQIILDCWELLRPKPSTIEYLKQYPTIYQTELLENQEELINQLRETLESVVDKIKSNGGDNEIL